MSGGGITFCPSCDRLLDNYNAAASRSDRDRALLALEEYDDHREDAHGRGNVA